MGVGLGCGFNNLAECCHSNPQCPTLSAFLNCSLPPPSFLASAFPEVFSPFPPHSQIFCIHVVRRKLQGQREPAPLSVWKLGDGNVHLCTSPTPKPLSLAWHSLSRNVTLKVPFTPGILLHGILPLHFQGPAPMSILRCPDPQAKVISPFLLFLKTFCVCSIRAFVSLTRPRVFTHLSSLVDLSSSKARSTFHLCPCARTVPDTFVGGANRQDLCYCPSSLPSPSLPLALTFPVGPKKEWPQGGRRFSKDEPISITPHGV